MRSLTSILVPIHPEGYRFIAIFALLDVLFFLVSPVLGWIGVILVLWCTYFFRDPARTTPQRDGLIISRADGVVNMITEAVLPPELGRGLEKRTRVSVFMNVFNCHVNRMPVSGSVEKSLYRTGQFLSADLDKASEANERHTMQIALPDGSDIIVVQIAGLVARRIVNYANEGDQYTVGERFGLIRFGSRLDIYLPEGVIPMVSLGQTAIAGETVLADADSDEAAREAVTQ